MLILNSISGNVYHDDQIKEEIHQAEKQQKLERLFLSRIEMEKSRLRKHTSDGLETVSYTHLTLPTIYSV